MSNKNNRFQDKLSEISSSGKAPQKKEVIQQIIHQEEDKPDFEQIARELQQRHEEEKRSLNDNHIKDTIYIQEDIYKAFNALCTERGLKKVYVNEAIADFVQKKYRELQQNK